MERWWQLQKCSPRSESYEPHIRLPSPEVLHREGKSPEFLAMKISRSYIRKIQKTERNRDSTPKGLKENLTCSKTHRDPQTPDTKNWLIRKRPVAGKDWRQEEKGATMAGCHHRLDGHELASSGSCWWTGKPGMLQSMGLQRVRHDWATELNWDTCWFWRASRKDRKQSGIALETRLWRQPFLGVHFIMRTLVLASKILESPI